MHNVLYLLGDVYSNISSTKKWKGCLIINCLLACLLNIYVYYSLGKNLLASGRKQRNMTPATAQYV